MFDYTVYKSNVGYSKQHYSEIKGIYERYRKVSKKCAKTFATHRSGLDDDATENRALQIEFIKAECECTCPNEDELCDIICDLCYTSEHSKQFAWDICGETMIKNLLRKNGGKISYPQRVDSDGEFEYAGDQFVMKTICVDPEQGWKDEYIV